MVSSLGTLIGGVGLLLIGMGLMTDGLKLAAGNTLRDVLALWTNTRARGLFSGFVITGIVQSSSAVTVATIGFANAGMLTLERAIWVIFGSNVGTTMTAWIVALIGFKLNIEGLALPVIGLGAILKLTSKSDRRGALGLSLVGFGLLFLGIGVLKGTFENLGESFAIPDIENLTFLKVLMFVGIGFLLTTLMQSSSAAMVIALSAAETGLVPLNAAAALVIGANLGTTSTSIISVFGATPLAKRVAVSHVMFNVLAACVAMLLLVPMLWFVGFIQDSLELDTSPAMALAIFHTVFNVLGVMLIWPLSGLLVKFLKSLFVSEQETFSKPAYLDKNVLAMPALAVDAMALEVARIAAVSVEVFRDIISPEGKVHALQTSTEAARALTREIGLFATELNRTALTPFLSEAITRLIETNQQYLRALEISAELNRLKSISDELLENHFNTLYRQYRDDLLSFIKQYQQALKDEWLMPEVDQDKHESSYKALKKDILRQAASGQVSMEDMDILLDFISDIRRIFRQLLKASARMQSIRKSLHRDVEGNVQPSAMSEKENLEIIRQEEMEPEQAAGEASVGR